MTLRIDRAIDKFLDWRALERDASERSNDSYGRILWKLADRGRDLTLADYEGRWGTELLRDFLAHWVRESREERGIELSAATRSTSSRYFTHFSRGPRRRGISR